MRTTKCKVFSFDADEGIGLGILLNLNANQDEKKGGDAKQGQTGKDRKKTTSKLHCRLYDVSLRVGKHWRARYRRFQWLSSCVSSSFILFVLKYKFLYLKLFYKLF